MPNKEQLPASALTRHSSRYFSQNPASLDDKRQKRIGQARPIISLHRPLQHSAYVRQNRFYRNSADQLPTTTPNLIQIICMLQLNFFDL